MPSWPRLGAALATACGSLVGVAHTPAAADQPPGPDPAAVLARARRAVITIAFQGRVRVEWVDGSGAAHQAQLPVRGGEGALNLGSLPVPSVVWGGGVRAAVPEPSPATKYRLTASPGPVVLGRTTTEVELDDGDLLAEVMDVDDTTGLVLRHQQLDGSGNLVRRVTFEELTYDAGGPMLHPHDTLPSSRAHVAAPFSTPAKLAAGYDLVGVYRRNSTVQGLYSDGVHTLSVFEQRGRLDASVLPSGGEPVLVGRWAATRYTWAGGQVVTWSAGSDATIVCVGDGPGEEVLAVARSLPPIKAATRGGVLGRIRRAAHKISELL